MLSFNKPAAIIAHCFFWQVNVGGTLPAADNLEYRVSCWPNWGGWDKDEVWWGRARACQYGAEAFQQQRQRQRRRHTEAGYLTLSQTKTQFPRKGTGKCCIFFIRFGVNAALCTKNNPSNRERTHSTSPLTPGCSFITQKQQLFWNKPLFFASHLLLYDATLMSMSAYTMFSDPATQCDWLRDTQCFIGPETPHKSSVIKAEDGVSVHATTTTHTWWLCKTTLFQSKFCFLSWNCTLYL